LLFFQDLYNIYSTPTNISVIGYYIGELHFEPNINYSVKDLYTGYNGLCKAFTFHQVYKYWKSFLLVKRFQIAFVFIETPSQAKVKR